MQTIQTRTLEDTMYYNKIPVFTYKINYPLFTTTCNPRAAANINQYYNEESKKMELYGRTTLYQQAVESAQYIQNNFPPFHSYEMQADYHTAYNSACITSLYLEQYTYLGGAHGATVRKADTWDFASGRKLSLHDFYPANSSFEEDIFRFVEKQIAAQLAASPSSFFDNYPQLLRENFRVENFYLTQDGVIIFYQQYDIAPYASGLPEFLIPFHP